MATIQALRKYSYKRYNGLYLPAFIVILLTVGSAAMVGADWGILSEGVGNGIAFVSVMFPPDWTAFPDMLQPAAESMLLAFLSTIFGTIISLFFALAASANLAGKYIRNFSRFLISLERSVPEIIILLILVAGFGLGTFPGVIALSLGCVGMLGKLFADAIEEIEPLVLESLHAIGADKAQVIAFGVLPVILPVIVTNAIFRFEINIRMSIVLGAVGAGGIGFELYNAFALLEYRRALTAIIVVLVMVFTSERVSDFIRNRSNDMKPYANYLLPSHKFKRRATAAVLSAVLIFGMCRYLAFDPLMLFSEFHYMTDLLSEMLPPNLGIVNKNGNLFFSLLQTIAMAVLGTIVGGSIAMVLAVLSAKNTTPHPFLRNVIRLLLAVERVIPSLIIVLIFVISVGLGAFAGTLTLIVGSVGMFGKLFADAIEHTEPLPLEAIRSVGAGRLQVIRYGILPQVLPSFIANFLYAFDVNLRTAIGLGIFGGGGIGFELHMALKLLRYRDALGMIVFIIILIVLIEKLSDFLRNKILAGSQLT